MISSSSTATRVPPVWVQARSHDRLVLKTGSSRLGGQPLRPGRYALRFGGLVIIGDPSDRRQYREIIVDRVTSLTGPADAPSWSLATDAIAARFDSESFETQELAAPDDEEAVEN